MPLFVEASETFSSGAAINARFHGSVRINLSTAGIILAWHTSMLIFDKLSRQRHPRLSFVDCYCNNVFDDGSFWPANGVRWKVNCHNSSSGNHEHLTQISSPPWAWTSGGLTLMWIKSNSSYMANKSEDHIGCRVHSNRKGLSFQEEEYLTLRLCF